MILLNKLNQIIRNLSSIRVFCSTSNLQQRFTFVDRFCCRSISILANRLAISQDKNFLEDVKSIRNKRITRSTKPELKAPLQSEQVIRVLKEWTDLAASGQMPRVLSVAEKNDAAKNISNLLSNGAKRMRNGYSKYNKIYEFDMNVPSIGQSKMVFTSVSGHVLDMDFGERHRGWHSCNPTALFDAPIITACPSKFKDIERTLEKEASTSQILIIWTDCDREGENIGFEVIAICCKKNPRLKVLRARFSEITRPAVERALANLVEPDKRQSDAVNVRRELDLRIGAAFTRFQTLYLQRQLNQIANQVVSYGSCQFPTLGFVVERYKKIKNFEPSPFWYLQMTHTKKGKVARFLWDRTRLFSQPDCLAVYTKVLENVQAKVLDISDRRKSKYRPNPMDTVQLEKMASIYLKMTAKRAMELAEKLYQKGLISYPRTETNMFPPEMDLRALVEKQTRNRQWGDFASRLMNEGVHPRQGNKSDKAHPPIHPIKEANDLTGEEAKLYELVVRHFLACVSSDAVGSERTIHVDVNQERFHLSGLVILERNFLDVYIYQKWFDKEIPVYEQDECFTPDALTMEQGTTTAPALLSEADLIALMEKHGIGTDATHAEHIDTIQKRFYAQMTRERRFLPKQLGLGLVEGLVNWSLDFNF